jgi:hypothetical protein
MCALGWLQHVKMLGAGELQTGAGKTYTVAGEARQYARRGIIPRAIHQIFREVDARVDKQILVRMSYMEIYNEVCSKGYHQVWVGPTWEREGKREGVPHGKAGKVCRKRRWEKEGGKACSASESPRPCWCGVILHSICKTLKDRDARLNYSS